MKSFLFNFFRDELEKDILFSEWILERFEQLVRLAQGLFFALLVCMLIGPRPAQAAGGIAAVWANDGGDKVTQDDLRVSQSGKNVANSVWDGTTIHVFGARNEVVSFNVVLEAPGGASNVSVSFNKLTGPNGGTIASVAAAGNQVFDFVNRNIELFYVRYVPIHGLSLVSYGNYDERQIPQRLQRPWTGSGYGSGTWQNRPDHDKSYPDIAVPLELVPTFSITAGHNQSVWVDVYIPKGLPTGIYQGTLVISEGGSPTHTIPVQLKVYNFSLPDVPAAKTMLYFSSPDINRRFLGTTYVDPNSAAGSQAKLIRDRYFMMAHRHGISLIGDNANDCSPVTDQPCPEWAARLSGSLFSAANGYDGPGVNVGNNVYAIGTYGTWGWQTGGQAAMNQNADAWVQWFSQNASGTEYFLYLDDESTNYAQTQAWAQSILNDPGPGHQLKSMATIALPTAAASVPSLDIPTSTIWQGIASQWQPLADQYTNDPRKRFYVYNGHRPASGSFATDDDGVALRELAWVQYKKNIDRWFFWESTYYNNYQGNTGEQDLFQTAQTFGNNSSVDPVLGQTGWNYANGDGLLFYPGTDVVFPKESYNVQGPLASLRLKEWRRGIQDVDYLTMAAAVSPAAVQVLVSSMVPQALWDYGVSDTSDPTWVRTNISWSNDPNAWETARAQLAAIIAPFQPFSAPATAYFNYPNISTLRLYWSASTGASGYRIDLATDANFVNGVAGDVNQDMGNTLSVNLSNLTPATTYYARVRAYDSTGNVSSNSVVAAMATLNANYAAFSVPVQVQLTSPTMSSLALSWAPSSSTSAFVAATYQVQVSTLQAFSDFASLPWSGLFYPSPTTSAVLSGLSSGVVYYVRIRASDSYGNESNYSPAVWRATTDTIPPSVPPSLTFNYPNTTTLRLYWGASTDNVGVAGYRIDLATDSRFASGVPGYFNLDVGNVLSLNLSGLAPGTAYYARARAYDAAGNNSLNTPAAVMSTLSGDYLAQSAPVQVALNNATPSTLSLSWLPSLSTDSLTVATYQVQVSSVSTFSNFAGQPWSGLFYQYPTYTTVLTGLLPGTPYYARIRANDAYGNTSNYSLTASAVTLSFGGGPTTFSSGLVSDAPALNAVRVYPNPWRKDRHQGSPIIFDQLDFNGVVKLFTVAGQWIKTLNVMAGKATWDLTNDSGERVASGLYIYLISDGQEQPLRGKLSVIR